MWCVYTCIHFCACECMWGGDKHLSPEAAFRFPLTSSVKSAQSLHCHLPATRERPAPHTDKLICLAVRTCTHARAQNDSYMQRPVAHAQVLVWYAWTAFHFLPKMSSNRTAVGDICYFAGGEKKCFLRNSDQNWSVIVSEKDVTSWRLQPQTRRRIASDKCFCVFWVW